MLIYNPYISRSCPRPPPYFIREIDTLWKADLAKVYNTNAFSCLLKIGTWISFLCSRSHSAKLEGKQRTSKRSEPLRHIFSSGKIPDVSPSMADHEIQMSRDKDLIGFRLTALEATHQCFIVYFQEENSCLCLRNPGKPPRTP